MYPWGDNRRFNSYAAYFRRTFGHRIQKVAVNAGFTCPNRDGTVGRGGCTFCDNAAFTPSYCTPAKSVTQQIDEGIEFHRRRYRTAGSFLVYFQSFSNTYAPLADLRRLYDEALAHPDVAGIVVGTRPDCVDEEKLDWFAELARDRYVALEYGIESTYDASLRAVNRGHDFDCARRAVEMTAGRGLPVGAHFILGLPGETDEMLLAHLTDAKALLLAMTWRQTLPEALESAQVRLAIILFNRMGMEGESEHVEGDVRRAAPCLPDELRREIIAFRRAHT